VVPLPSLPEQRRIAAILDKAHAIRELRRQSIAKLDTLLKAVFVEMFGDPVTNPKGWPVIKLGDRIINGPQNGLYKPSSEYGEGTPILRIDSFYDGAVLGMGKLKRVRLNESERNLYSLAENDIVINRVNSLSHLGKSAIILRLSELTVFESNMMRMSFDTSCIHPLFIIHYLQSNHIKSQIMNCAKNAVNQSSINQTDVKGFRIFEPPIGLQRSFADLVSKVRGLQEKYSSSLKLSESLFNSLQQRAFSGKLFTEKAAAAAQQELFAD
jgi:type I restriction enzyme S subunit